MDNDIRIIKNDHQGHEVWHYKGEIIAQSTNGIIAKAHFNRADLEFNGVVLKENDCFFELYLFDKWFNIYEIFDRDSGILKAWYCNITKPFRQGKSEIFYDDLALDLLVFPDGRRMVLDEDEFEALNLTQRDQLSAKSALFELERLFEAHTPLDIFTLL
jgi:hypothetical protein